MKDTELRGLLLQKYYESRRGDMFCPTPEDINAKVTQHDIYAVCEQLSEHNLIQWKSFKGMGGTLHGMGKISAHGVDVIEEGVSPEIKIEFVQSKTVNNITDSYNTIGNGNTGINIGANNSSNNNFQMQSTILKNDIPLKELALDLKELITEINTYQTPDSLVAVGSLKAAEMSAEQNKKEDTYRYLKSAGKFSLSVAEKLGLPLALEALRIALSS